MGGGCGVTPGLTAHSEGFLFFNNFSSNIITSHVLISEITTVVCKRQGGNLCISTREDAGGVLEGQGRMERAGP